MKRINLMAASFVFIIVLAFATNASALSTNLKSTYSQAETIIIKLTGKILEPITSKQVQFMRAGHFQEVPVEYEIEKLGEDYYLWAVAPKDEGNYTLIINRVSSIEKGVPKKIDFQQNFSVKNDSVRYSIKPGVIVSDRDFEIKVISYQDEDFSISTDFPEEREINIRPGVNTINFSIADVAGAVIRSIRVGDYDIPAYLIGNFMKLQENNSIQFEPGSISRIYHEGENEVISFAIINKGESRINNITIKYPSDIFALEPDANVSLDKGESAYYNLSITNRDELTIREIIYASSDELDERRTALPVSIDFENLTSEEDNNFPQLYRCAELGGKICTGEEVCSGEKNLSIEGMCCMGTCDVTSNGGSSTSRLIGYVIGIIVISGLVYLYIKYKKSKGETNLLPKKIKQAERNIP